MAKKKTGRRKWIVGAIIIIMVGAGFAIRAKQAPAGLEVTTETVQTGTITSLVTATGRIHAQTQISITSEVPGEIVELPVRDGMPVERGQLLARVNPDTLEAQVKQQEAALASTRANSASQRASMLQAQLDLQRIQDLAERGFTSPSDLDQARTRLEAARASHEASLHQIERQEMQLREARDQLAKATLFSPMSGTVVELTAELGDRVVGTGQFAGTTIMRVANLEEMEIRVEVSEVDIINVAIGNVATIEVDALPDRIFRGKVTEIANYGLTSDARSQDQQTTFVVRIALDEPGSRLRPGMTATADIETNTVTDVVKAPLGSVVVRPRRELLEFLPQRDGDAAEASGERAPRAEAAARPAGRPGGSGGDRARRTRDDRVRVVFLYENGAAQLRIVETGIADRDYIEIKSGLQGGEQIITGPYRALARELKHDDPVRQRAGNGTPQRRR